MAIIGQSSSTGYCCYIHFVLQFFQVNALGISTTEQQGVQLSRPREGFSIRVATDKFSINPDTRNCALSSHCVELFLYRIPCIHFVKLKDHRVRHHLVLSLLVLKAFLCRHAIRAIGLGEDDNLVCCYLVFDK